MYDMKMTSRLGRISADPPNKGRPFASLRMVNMALQIAYAYYSRRYAGQRKADASPITDGNTAERRAASEDHYKAQLAVCQTMSMSYSVIDASWASQTYLPGRIPWTSVRVTFRLKPNSPVKRDSVTL